MSLHLRVQLCCFLTLSKIFQSDNHIGCMDLLGRFILFYHDFEVAAGQPKSQNQEILHYRSNVVQ